MFHQIFDKFDTSLNFDAYQPNTNRLNALGTDWVVEQSKQLWDLWVKDVVMFRFSDYSSTTLTHMLESMAFLYNNQSNLLNPACQPAQRSDGTRFWPYDSQPSNVRDIWAIEPNRRIKDLRFYNNWFEQFVGWFNQATYVEVPYTMLTRQLGDISQKTDVVAATGLETLEIFNDFDGLKAKSIPLLGLNLNEDPNNQQHCKQFKSVLAALCTDVARRRILASWPGWQEMFESKDDCMLSSKSTVQSYVTGKGHNASEYERFCTALTYNINSMGNRVKLPAGKQYEAATDIVRTQWPDLLQSVDINDRLLKLSTLLEDVRKVLSQDRDSTKKEKNSPTTSYTPTLNPESTDYKDRHRDLQVAATPTQLVESETKQDGYEFVEAKIQTVAECKAQSAKSRMSQDLVAPFKNFGTPVEVNDDLRDQASTAAWFVPNPPPSEHGQTSGSLDEGALHRFAGWGDTHIFDRSSDVGSGEVAITVLVDCSSSMSGRTIIQAKSFLDAIFFGCKRKPNVHISAFGFAHGDQWCEMLYLDRQEDVHHLAANGSTPTAAAIQNAGRWLESMHPNAARGMIVLTDGEPMGCVRDLKRESVILSNNQPTVARAVSELPFPVIGVGFGCATAKSMAAQYGHGDHYMVTQPEEAIKVICDVLQSATV